jgi:hypothetical protein
MVSRAGSRGSSPLCSRQQGFISHDTPSTQTRSSLLLHGKRDINQAEREVLTSRQWTLLWYIFRAPFFDLYVKYVFSRIFSLVTCAQTSDHRHFLCALSDVSFVEHAPWFVCCD